MHAEMGCSKYIEIIGNIYIYSNNRSTDEVKTNVGWRVSKKTLGEAATEVSSLCNL